MNNNASNPVCEKSYDEQKIFEILQKKEYSLQRTINIHAEYIPGEKDFHDLGYDISSYNLKMNTLMINPAPRPITCRKKLLAPFIIFFRKFIRKFFLKWYIEPICDQQTDFNIATHNAVTNMIFFNERHLAALNDLYEKHEKLYMEFQMERDLRIELEKRVKSLERGEKK